MPLYIGDYLRDTLGLSRADHGSYLLLIMAYWSNGGPLPDDDDCLREIARCDRQDWARCRGLMLRFFSKQDGVWAHKRVDEELDAAHKRKEKAQKSAQSRWEQHQADAQPDAQVMLGSCSSDAQAVPESCSSPSPSPSPSKSSKVQATKLPTKPSRPVLTEAQKRLADWFEEALKGQWTNDAGKWVRRIVSNSGKSMRVLSELNLASCEGRIKTTPAQYAEQIWKEFK